MMGARFLLRGKAIVVCTGEGWHERALKCTLVRGTQYDQIQMLKPGAFDTWVDVDHL